MTAAMPWPFRADQPENPCAAFTTVLELLESVPEREHAEWLERAYQWAAGSAGEIRRERARRLENRSLPAAAVLVLEDARSLARDDARAQAWTDLDSYCWAAMHYRSRLEAFAARRWRGASLSKTSRKRKAG